MTTYSIPTDFLTIADAMTVGSGVADGDTIQLENGYSGETASITIDGLFFDGNTSNTGIVLQLAGGVDVTLTGTAPISVEDGTGSNTITGNDGANSIKVTADSDQVGAGLGNDTLVVDYSAQTHGILTSGFGAGVSGFGGEYYNDTIPSLAQVNFTGIENFDITTGGGNDILTTGSGNDIFNTGLGNDEITAGTGNLTIDGGGGGDGLAADLSAFGAINLNLQDNTFSGPAGLSITNIEYLQSFSMGGGSFTTGNGGDTIVTRAAVFHEDIRTGGGDDRVTVAGGVDVVTFGTSGQTLGDTLVLDYSAQTVGIFSSGVVDNGVSGFDGQYYHSEVPSLAQVTFTSAEHFDIRTGSGNDKIITGYGHDIFTTGFGNDEITAGTGNLTVDGGGGDDGLAADLSAFAAINLNLQDNTFTGPMGLSITNIEYLQSFSMGGGSFTTGNGGDTIVTRAAVFHEDIRTGGGDDRVTVAGGVDVVTFGTSGQTLGDTLVLDYSAQTVGIFSSGVADNGVSGFDGQYYHSEVPSLAQVTFTSAEHFDIRTGSGNDNITTGDGDDIFDTGAGGDTIDGNGGIDTVTYAASAAGVIVDLAAGTASGGDAAGDTLFDIENLIGSAQVDRFTGSTANNTFTGGAARDHFSFLAGLGDDVVTDFDAANEVLHFSSSAFASAAAVLAAKSQSGADTLIDDGFGNTIILQNVTATSVTAKNIDIIGVNDEPFATNLTQTKGYTEGGASVALDDIVVGDVDESPAQTITATLTLSSAAAGVLTTTGGGSFNAGAWSITDTIANVNAALAAVAFAPATNNDVDATITTHIEDQNAAGPANGSITLDVTPVNDAPAASNLTQTKAYTEGASGVALDDIVVSEVDTSPAQSITATLTLSNNAAGLLTTSGTATYTSGTGVWTITGTAAQVNAALAAVAFTPATNNDVDATITTHIEDQNAAGPANGSITLDVTPVNDAPAASNLTQTKAYTEGASGVALDDIVVSEVDTSPAQSITATLTLSNTAAGFLTISGGATYTSGTGVWSITDTIANVNAALAAVAFAPATNNDVDATITTHIEDQNAAGPANGSITLDVTPVNDAPAASNLTQTKVYTEGASGVALDDIVVSEVDTSPAQSITATLTLSNNAAGLLTTSGTATYTSGTGVWTITGTAAQVNAALAAVAFTPATNNDVDATITTHIEDQNAVGPANGTITLDVTPVNGTGAAPSDFNGDAISDVLWRHASGSVSEWLMNAGQIGGNQSVATPSPAWHFQDSGDFNADGRSDVLWRHDNGQVVLWQMDGSTILFNQSLATIGNDWHNEGVGDFNGDGRADALWHNDNGQVALWTMDGAQITNNQLVASVGGSWHFQGLLDANGDGKSDVLLRDNSGQVVLWTMDGAQITNNQSIANLGLDWNIVGTGDFGGDGRGDVLLRNDSGQVVIWQMNGAQIESNLSVATPGNEWKVQDVGDYNSDGRSDVLWRHDNGQVVMWEMNGAQIASNHTVTHQGGAPAPIGLDWTALNHHYDLL